MLFCKRITAAFFQACRCGRLSLLQELGMTMEVVAQVLLGPSMPALSYLCGPWRGPDYLNPESVDLAVQLLDKAYERELPFMHKNM